MQLAASGLCHSDAHVVAGSSPVPFMPVLGGHEGAGVITKVGPGVTGLAEGDHVVLAFVPACGTCPSCATGLQNLCDEGAGLLTGLSVSDKTYRVTRDGQPVIQMCLLGTFAPYVTVSEASVVKIENDVPLEVAALLGCGVSTGWGSATEIGDTRPGDTVVVDGDRRGRDQRRAGCAIRGCPFCRRDRPRRLQTEEGARVRRHPYLRVRRGGRS